jgi:DNA-binding transcriptional LysR family regulator
MKDVHQLRVFLAVAENLSFTKAAQGLFLTQSAVSHQIARLERELGKPLVSREGRQIALTNAGQVLAQQARRVFAVLAEAETAVKAADRPDLGQLTIGASSTACQFLIPEALREFRECYPGYSLSILPGDTPLVTERLLEGSLDLGILTRSSRKARLRYYELFTDELGFLVSPLHPWAKAKKVDRRTLGEQRFVLYSRNSETFRIVERYLLRTGAPLRDWIELGSMEAIKELVKLGLGISITARWIARPQIAEGSLVWLPLRGGGAGGTLKRTWCIAAAPQRKLSMAEQTFVGLCQAVATQFEE